MDGFQLHWGRWGWEACACTHVHLYKYNCTCVLDMHNMCICIFMYVHEYVCVNASVCGYMSVYVSIGFFFVCVCFPLELLGHM